ncbi:MAG TPA: YbgF trimerization domain-containing protein, partial [Arenimonas sp.]|nr:YbgF trimerization domain-containing protein [Arenimonas sp.]
MGHKHFFFVLTVVAALVAATPAMAQRLSLAERVTQLENAANAQNQGAGQANLETQNRLVELQGEVSSLRNLVETLQNEIAQLKQTHRQQYIDLDARLARLEGGAPAASPNSAAPAPAAAAAAPATGPASAGAAPAAAATVDPAAEDAAYQAALNALVERYEAADSARL